MVAGMSSAGLTAEVTRSIKVDGDFQPANIRYAAAVSGGYDALIALKANNGYIELCGVGKYTNMQLRQFVRKGVRTGRLKINGKVVLKNFLFFANAKGPLKASAANCARTTHKASVRINDIDFRYGNASARN